LGKTPWSTEYHFSWESQRNDDTTRRIQPYPELWNSTLEAGFRQPLLRGRGPAIASAPVRRAGITLSAAQARALEEADQVAAAVERAYALYELACADERIAGISQRALATLQKNQEQNQLGLLSGIDLVAAERRHVDRQASLVAARQVRKDAQDALLALAYGAGAPAALAAGETPSPEAGPGLTEIPDLPALESCEARALERRKVLQAAHQDLEALQLDARLARDTLRPALDLTGSYRLQGLNNKSDGLTASSQAYAAGVRGWTVGLELTVPLPGRAARGAVRRAEANVREQELALQGMEVQVRTQVRSAYRAVQDTRVRLGMEGKVRELAEAHFTGETERFRLGLTTFFTLQQVEEEMDQADLIEAWARYDLEVAVSAIRQAMGESAETYLH
jgi:outer membrane protein TolC